MTNLEKASLLIEALWKEMQSREEQNLLFVEMLDDVLNLLQKIAISSD